MIEEYLTPRRLTLCKQTVCSREPQIELRHPSICLALLRTNAWFGQNLGESRHDRSGSVHRPVVAISAAFDLITIDKHLLPKRTHFPPVNKLMTTGQTVWKTILQIRNRLTQLDWLPIIIVLEDRFGRKNREFLQEQNHVCGRVCGGDSAVRQ